MGLLDDELITGLLGAQPRESGGLLGNGALAWRPGPNEGLATRIFGDPNNPADPRGDVMMALASGLLRRDFAGGLDRAGRVFAETEDRNTRRAANSLALNKSAYELAGLKQAYDRNAAIQSDLAARRSAPQSQGLSAGAGDYGVPPMGGIPMFSMGPRRAGGTQVGAAGAATSTGTEGQAPQLYRRLLQMADVYSRNGDIKTAMDLYQRAEQFKPKFSTTPQVMIDPQTGRPVNVVLNEDGGMQVVPFGVKPDISMQDLGGRVVAVDKNATPGGQVFPKTMSPGEAASNQVALANFAQRQREFANTVSQQGKPTFQDGRWVYPPSAQNPQGVAVAPTGMPPKALTEFQGKSTSYAARMQDASKVIAELEGQKDGPPSPMQVSQAGYRAEFPSWLPGGQIVGGIATGMNNTLNPMVTEGAQRYRQAQENWVAAALRQESGAAIGKEELEKYIRTFFPQPGDSDAVKAQKANARQVAERGMLTQAGAGAQQIPSILDGDKGPPSATGAPDWKYVNGKLVKVK